MAETVSEQPTFRTSRLLLRPFDLADESSVFEICRDREIAANTRSIPHPYPREQAAHWIKQHSAWWKNGKSAIFAICDGDQGQVIGAVGLEIHPEDQNAELGYWIGKNWWGRGFCTEAAAKAVKFGFEFLALHRIHAHHVQSNPASGRVLEKIGMRPEGILRQHFRKWGQFHDIVVYGLLRSEFQKSVD